MNDNFDVATFAGGCFWCGEAIFNRLRGVYSVVSGYSGGQVENPTYEQVSRGVTGHTECIQIQFNSKIIPYDALLDIFFGTHDPTTLDRQDGDVGPQYRSVIFYHNKAQKKEAEKKISELSTQKIYREPLVTEVVSYATFYPAEDYHQSFYEKNRGTNMYCNTVINPKIWKLRERYRKFVKMSDLG